MTKLTPEALAAEEIERWRYRPMTPSRWEWFVDSLFLTLDDLRAAKERAEMQAKWHQGVLGAENPYGAEGGTE